MKFGLPMPHTMRLKAMTQPWESTVTGNDQAVIARRAEELGYDMLAIPEHFVVPNTHVEFRARTTSTPPSPRRSSPAPPNISR